MPGCGGMPAYAAVSIKKASGMLDYVITRGIGLLLSRLRRSTTTSPAMFAIEFRLGDQLHPFATGLSTAPNAPDLGFCAFGHAVLVRRYPVAERAQRARR